MKNRAKWLMAAVALTGVAGAVYAQTSNSSDSASPGSSGAWHFQHRDGMMGGGMMLHALQQLNLTDEQKQSVKTILTNARTQLKAQRHGASSSNFAALSNPGDPNHAAALQELEARVTAGIETRDQVRQQIYGVLTADQKTQFASIIAARQARMAQRNAS
jgi:Spy/CpxP family protein refolding chaperone